MEKLMNIMPSAKIKVTGFELNKYMEHLFVEKFEKAIAYKFDSVCGFGSSDIYLLNNDDLAKELNETQIELRKEREAYTKYKNEWTEKYEKQICEVKEKAREAYSKVHDLKKELAKPWWKRQNKM